MLTCEKFTKNFEMTSDSATSGEMQAGGLDRNSNVREVAMLRSLKVTG
jgi:hypothetical protein